MYTHAHNLPKNFIDSQYWAWASPVQQIDLIALSHGDRGSSNCGSGWSPSNTVAIAAVDSLIAERL